VLFAFAAIRSGVSVDAGVLQEGASQMASHVSRRQVRSGEVHQVARDALHRTEEEDAESVARRSGDIWP